MIDGPNAAVGRKIDGRVSLSAKTLRMQKSMRLLGCAKMSPILPTLAGCAHRRPTLCVCHERTDQVSVACSLRLFIPSQHHRPRPHLPKPNSSRQLTDQLRLYTTDLSNQFDSILAPAIAKVCNRHLMLPELSLEAEFVS